MKLRVEDLMFPIKTLGKALKSDSHLPKKISVICLIESPLRMMKNVFCFILKALFVQKLFKFLSRLFSHIGKTT